MFIVAQMSVASPTDWKKHEEFPDRTAALEYVNRYNLTINGRRDDSVLAVFSEREWADYRTKLEEEIRAYNDRWAEEAEDNR